jgi:hypothetical protein
MRPPSVWSGSEKDDPGGEVVREILEAVVDPGRHEERVAGREVLPLPVIEERALARHDDIKLVALVRPLPVPPDRPVDAHIPVAVIEHPEELRGAVVELLEGVGERHFQHESGPAIRGHGASIELCRARWRSVKAPGFRPENPEFPRAEGTSHEIVMSTFFEIR